MKSNPIEKYKRNFRKLLANKSFINAVNEIRTDNAIPLNGLAEENYKKWFESSANELKFRQDILSLIKKFGRSVYYFNAVREIILFGQTGILPKPLILGSRPNEFTKEREISLIIFGDTTLEDIKAFWPEIKMAQAGKPLDVLLKSVVKEPQTGYKPRQQKFGKNFERDEQIRKWREEDKLTIKETYRRAKEAGYKVDQTEIPKLIKRHKEYIGELGK
jgi:hypothetical protein